MYRENNELIQIFAQLGSYGTWWQSLQKEDEKEKNFFHKDETASRYWPLGKNVLIHS